jgi:hypothetical protein
MVVLPPRTSKNRNLPLIVGLFGLSAAIVLGSLACLLFVIRLPAGRALTPTPLATSSGLDLPTAAPATATPGPPVPDTVNFVAEEPIKGYSDCNRYGFRGVVKKGNGDGQRDVQIVVWQENAGLLALSSTDETGKYALVIDGLPAERKLWVQVFENDLPVSLPVFLETQIDCQSGYQIYEIDWQQADE